MTTVVELEGITFDLQMHEKPIYVEGCGWSHIANLIGSYDRDDMSKLVGQKLWDKEILGVESFAIPTLTDRPIGLLTKEKMWEGK